MLVDYLGRADVRPRDFDHARYSMRRQRPGDALRGGTLGGFEVGETVFYAVADSETDGGTATSAPADVATEMAEAARAAGHPSRTC